MSTAELLTQLNTNAILVATKVGEFSSGLVVGEVDNDGPREWLNIMIEIYNSLSSIEKTHVVIPILCIGLGCGIGVIAMTGVVVSSIDYLLKKK